MSYGMSVLTTNGLQSVVNIRGGRLVYGVTLTGGYSHTVVLPADIPFTTDNGKGTVICLDINGFCMVKNWNQSTRTWSMSDPNPNKNPQNPLFRVYWVSFA
jgi:hypothetical protein